MTLSDALKWAWAEELPKEHNREAAAGVPNGAMSAWASILRYGETGTIVDRQPNRFGCIPFDEAGFPHADALAMADAVARLVDCEIGVPDGWNPMPGLDAVDADLSREAVADVLAQATRPDRDGVLRFRRRADRLIVRHAILGLAPDWQMAAAPVRKYETTPNGQPVWYVRRKVSSVVGVNPDGSDHVTISEVEVDGWSPRLKRPVHGAYQKAYLSPDPVPVMVARAEYEVFCVAMRFLFDELAGALETIDLIAPDWPDQPWGDSPEKRDVKRAGRILPDLTPPPETVSPEKKSRKIKALKNRSCRRK